MLGLKLNHVSKRGHSSQSDTADFRIFNYLILLSHLESTRVSLENIVILNRKGIVHGEVVCILQRYGSLVLLPTDVTTR